VRVSGYIFALALAATGSGVAAAQQAAAPEQLASVKGVVTNAFTGEPLRKALVRLDPESGNDARPATTDEQGRFSFENLKPGTYGLAAERVGFIRSLLADSAGTTVKLRLAAGETANVNLKLAPQAAISGRVVDSDEDPWANVSLQLYRSVFKQGKRRLERHDLAEVDDRGQFRVGNYRLERIT
jgi:hypothetical protein